MKIIRICSFCFFGFVFLSGTALFALGKADKAPVQNETAKIETVLLAETAQANWAEPMEVVQAGEPEESAQASEPEEPAQASRAELTMKAFAAAHPTRISPAEFRDGDWAVQVYGKWFYYAEGRLLPEELRSHTSEYAPHNLYNYSAELPPWQAPTAEAAAHLRLIAGNRRQSSIGRSPHFFNALWRAENRSAAWDRVKQIRFLGKPLLVHYSILEVLSLIEEKILEQSRTRPEIRQWMNELGTVEGWNWREIAESPNRSFHSYGVAVDILPKTLKGLQTYWLTTARTNAEWWNVPYSRRYHPPQEIIKIFESYGFIWGGKWQIYDTMHFEYRPEIFIYNNLPLEQFR